VKNEEMYKPIVVAVIAGLMVGCTTVGRKMDNNVGRTNKGAMVLMASRTLSVSIACPPDKVYEFVSNPENIPKWAKGLGKSVSREGSYWIVESSLGSMKVRFAENNKFGVLDQYVTTPSGVEVYVPLRVLANGKGSEVIFTLFRLPDMTDEQYTEDSKMVEQDLKTLKDLLEK
jgi:hypothetical protein